MDKKESGILAFSRLGPESDSEEPLAVDYFDRHLVVLNMMAVLLIVRVGDYYEPTIVT